MLKIRLPLLALILLGLFSSSLWASKVDALIEPAAKRLDYRFFYWLFDEEGLGRAYTLAQDEDFEAGEKMLFTDEMLSLFKVPQRNWEDKLGDLDELWYLEEEMKTLDTKVANELVQKWRYTFLQKMMEYLRQKANRKPLLKFMVMSSTSYNSNIVRADDVDLTSGAVTGEEDGQQLFLLNMRWMPFVNKAGFSRENKFHQSFNIIRIHQFSHKENQVLLVDTESKWTRKMEGSLENFSLAYRLQNFGLSGDAASRDTHSKFFSHRLKAGLSLKAIPLSGSLKSTKSEFALTYILKEQLNDVEKIVLSDKDAVDFRISAKQSLKYVLGEQAGNASAQLEIVNYSNDDFAAGDYDYWTLSLENKNKFKLSHLNHSLRLSEKFSIRKKGWSNGAAPTQDEALMVFAVKASTRINDSWDSYFSASHGWRDRDSNTNVKTDADQTVITLGFIWSTP